MNCPKLTEFILDCQDPERGGISDRPDDRTDVYHTFFGVAGFFFFSFFFFFFFVSQYSSFPGLSLMGYKGLVKIDPVYALPVPIAQKLNLQNAKIVEKDYLSGEN